MSKMAASRRLFEKRSAPCDGLLLTPVLHAIPGAAASGRSGPRLRFEELPAALPGKMLHHETESLYRDKLVQPSERFGSLRLKAAKERR
jgi:hypothetical protein